MSPRIAVQRPAGVRSMAPGRSTPTRRSIVAALVPTLLLVIAPTAWAQDGGDRRVELVEHTDVVEIPRSGRTPYVVRVSIPRQVLRGDRFRAVLRPPEIDRPPIHAFGRLTDGAFAPAPPRPAAANAVAMETITLQVESVRIEASANGGKMEIWGWSHEVQSPRDASASGGDGAALRRVEFRISVPDILLQGAEHEDSGREQTD